MLFPVAAPPKTAGERAGILRSTTCPVISVPAGNVPAPSTKSGMLRLREKYLPAGSLRCRCCQSGVPTATCPAQLLFWAAVERGLAEPMKMQPKKMKPRKMQPKTNHVRFGGPWWVLENRSGRLGALRVRSSAPSVAVIAGLFVLVAPVFDLRTLGGFFRHHCVHRFRFAECWKRFAYCSRRTSHLQIVYDFPSTPSTDAACRAAARRCAHIHKAADGHNPAAGLHGELFGREPGVLAVLSLNLARNFRVIRLPVASDARSQNRNSKNYRSKD